MIDTLKKMNQTVLKIDCLKRLFLFALF